MSSAVDELWSVARQQPQVDANALARAVEAACTEPLDYRTRLLIRDSISALRDCWGNDCFSRWLEQSSKRMQIERAAAHRSPDDEVAFPYLSRNVVDPIQPETVLQLLREISSHVTAPTRLVIGGSIALVLSGDLMRFTQDIDIVDELPAELRKNHELLEKLAQRYRLRLTHFQSHYLPDGWEGRVHSIGAFGKLQVFIVDLYDVFIGKLFSARTKDLDDLRALAPKLDRQTLVRRLSETTAAFRSDARLLDAAKNNWFIVVGESLPQ